MAQRVSVKQEVGFIFCGRIIKWERLDDGSIGLWTKTHQQGADHKAIRSTDCRECLMKFRREVLGHNV